MTDSAGSFSSESITVSPSVLAVLTRMAPCRSDSLLGVDNYERGDIKALYFGAKVLITGASGFVGKVLIESLLRKTEVERVYVLIRNKRNKTPEERLKDILKDTVFQNLKADSPERLSAIVAVSGDVSIPNLGLSAEDEETLRTEVEIVFHGAATVHFNENLKLATEINVTGTKRIMNLARKMRNLKVIMHVSTAFSNAHLDEIDEEIYPVNDRIDIIKMTESINYDTANNITKEIIGDSANTYVYTKRVAEDLIEKDYKDLPVGILRPGIVIGAISEPVTGWVDNLYGPTGMVIGMMMGLVHCTVIKRSAKADLVPVDTVTNCLISSAWDTYTRYIMSGEERKISVYNVVSSPLAPISWGEFQDEVLKESQNVALSRTVWYPFSTSTTSWPVFRLLTLILHYLPAILVDWVRTHTGRKPKMVKMFKKIDDVMEVLVPFCTREWVFRAENVHSLWKKMSRDEQELFPFHFQGFDWRGYLYIYFKGVKRFMIKDTINEKASRNKIIRLYIFHYILLVTLLAIFASLVYYIIPNQFLSTLA